MSAGAQVAIAQVLVAHLGRGLPLGAAIEAPRLHVEVTDAGPRIACEPGIGAAQLPWPVRAFPALAMFFGGVGAARWSPRAGLDAATDPRRAGSAFAS